MYIKSSRNLMILKILLIWFCKYSCIYVVEDLQKIPKN